MLRSDAPTSDGRRRPGSSQHLQRWVRRHAEALAYGALATEFVWVRFAKLQASFNNDEAASATLYIDRSLVAIYSSTEYATNNHILFEILSWLTVALLGRHEPAYRIWSVLPAIASAVLLVWWARRRLGRVAGLALAVILLTAPLLFRETILASGYGLEQFGVTLLFIGAAELEEGELRRAPLRVLALGILIGCAAQISMISVVPLVVLWLIRRRDRRWPVIGYVALAAVGLAIVIGPLAQTIVHTAPRDEAGAPGLPFRGVVTGPAELGAYTGQLLLTGRNFNSCENNCYTTAQLAGWGWVLYVPALIGIVALWRWRRRGLLGLLFVMVVGTFVLLVGAHIGVNDRFFLYLFPVYAVLAATGVAFVVHAAVRRPFATPVIALAGAAALVFCAGRVYRYDQTLAPFPDTKGLAAAVIGSGITTAEVNTPHNPFGLNWYLPHVVVYVPPGQLQHELCHGPPTRPIALVQLYVPLSAHELACLRRRHASSEDFPGSGSGLLRLWLIRAPGIPGFTERVGATGSTQQASP